MQDLLNNAPAAVIVTTASVVHRHLPDQNKVLDVKEFVWPVSQRGRNVVGDEGISSKQVSYTEIVDFHIANITEGRIRGSAMMC
jgi:hypothetical protein